MLRFYSKTKRDSITGCLNWTASVRKDGYGRFRYNQKTVLAHRMAWKLYKGRFPNKLCLHKCDNKSCVNPRHLYLGTQEDNMQDRAVRGNPNNQDYWFKPGNTLWKRRK